MTRGIHPAPAGPGPARAPLRLAHASDIHLDTDFHDGSPHLVLRDQYRLLFAQLLERILAQRPQVLLIPGDLFDSNRPSPETVIWAMERLAGLPMPVVMIPGNHDCLEAGAIYLRHDFNRIPNTRLLMAADGEMATIPELGVNVWGKGMVDHSPEFSPLGGLPPALAGAWNLALGHGIYVGRDGHSHRSSPVEARQIEASGYDYIALGHHHALLKVSSGKTSAYYCGAPIPISKGSQGTFVMVTLEDGQPTSVDIHKL